MKLLLTSILYRFYVVSSKDGWYPSGTKCAENSYCLMGKCLEFGSDQTPINQLSEEDILDFNTKIQPRYLRHKRELLIEPPVRVGIGESFSVNDTKEYHEISEIAFDQPVDVEEWMPNADFEAFTNHVSKTDLSLLLFILCLFLG